MKYTETEISLCKEIAEHWRKPVTIDDLAYRVDRSKVIRIDGDCYLTSVDGTKLKLKKFERSGWCFEEMNSTDWFPLWTWRDCREWLRERGWRLLDLIDEHDILDEVLPGGCLRGVDTTVSALLTQFRDFQGQ